jgi:uncharacterized protein (TIGR02598 family)
MKSRPAPFRFRSAVAFSLVEVVLALGILAFCLMAVFGLIPTGLNSQRVAEDEARAVTALNMTATAVRSAVLDSRTSDGVATYKLPSFLSEHPLSDTNNAINVQVGASDQTYRFALKEDGTIRRSDESGAEARQTLYLKVSPPVNATAPIQVYAAVVWPARDTDATITPAEFKNRAGFLDAFVSYVPRK